MCFLIKLFSLPVFPPHVMIILIIRAFPQNIICEKSNILIRLIPFLSRTAIQCFSPIGIWSKYLKFSFLSLILLFPKQY